MIELTTANLEAMLLQANWKYEDRVGDLCWRHPSGVGLYRLNSAIEEQLRIASKMLPKVTQTPDEWRHEVDIRLKDLEESKYDRLAEEAPARFGGFSNCWVDSRPLPALDEALSNDFVTQALETAWGIIANAGMNTRPGPVVSWQNGIVVREAGWARESEEWVAAAANWRDKFYHAWLDAKRAAKDG